MGLTITDAIIELVEEYGYSPEEINCGQCWDFAEDLEKLFPEGEVQHNRMLNGFKDEGWDHAFFSPRRTLLRQRGARGRGGLEGSSLLQTMLNINMR